MTHWKLCLAAVMAASLLAGCRKQPTPTVPVPTPETVAFESPELVIAQTPVSFRKREPEEAEQLTAGEAITVSPGANVLVGEGGRASLAWTGVASTDMFSGADVLLSLSDPATRQIIVDQATGTARYALAPAGPECRFGVKANWADLELSAPGADALVSYVPGPDPSVWFVIMSGTGTLTRGEAAEVALADGQAIGLTATGTIGDPETVDTAAVQAWLDQVAAGAPQASIASVALRCRATGEIAAYLAQPSVDAEPVGESLASGTVLEVLERDEAGSWLHVRPLASMTTGWVEAGQLACNGPAMDATIATVEPTATPAPIRPVVTIVRPTPAPAGSLTPTATPVSAVKIFFDTTDASILKGTCSSLVWEVQGIKEVYVDGRGVTGKGEMEVCPKKTTTYVMRVVHVDGRIEERSVEIEVREPEKTEPPAATNTPEPEPTSEPPTPTEEAPPEPTATEST